MPNEAITETTVEEPKKARKPRKPKKIRTTEEILELSLDKLSGAEKDKLIEHYKEELASERTKNTMIRTNAEKAYEALRTAEDDYKSMENFFNGRLNYVEQQTKAFANSIMAGIKGGTN